MPQDQPDIQKKSEKLDYASPGRAKDIDWWKSRTFQLALIIAVLAYAVFIIAGRVIFAGK
jgi:hypothetical protein